MSFIISNCTYCRATNLRLDNKGFNRINNYQIDILAVCSHCNQPTVFRLTQKSSIPYPLNEHLPKVTKLEDFKDFNLSLYFSIGSTLIPPRIAVTPCPEHVPSNIKSVFDEATTCLSLNCYTASGAMFRLCLDLTTKELLNEWLESNKNSTDQPNSAQKDKLFNRIEFLIKQGIIPLDLKDYVHHIRLDGNDAAHDGNTQKEETEDLLDFSELFLERIYTIKKQLEIAQARRIARRTK